MKLKLTPRTDNAVLAQMVRDAIVNDPRMKGYTNGDLHARAKVWHERAQKLKENNRMYYSSIADLYLSEFLCAQESSLGHHWSRKGNRCQPDDKRWRTRQDSVHERRDRDVQLEVHPALVNPAGARGHSENAVHGDALVPAYGKRRRKQGERKCLKESNFRRSMA